MQIYFSGGRNTLFRHSPKISLMKFLVELRGIEPPNLMLVPMPPILLASRSRNKLNLIKERIYVYIKTALLLVEARRFERPTPCLQSRCSPNWATPPAYTTILLRNYRKNYVRDKARALPAELLPLKFYVVKFDPEPQSFLCFLVARGTN